VTVTGPHFAFPGICDLGNGELIMFARDGPGHGGTAQAIRSWRTTNGNDATPTWTQDADVVTRAKPPVDWRDPCAMTTGQGTIIVTMFGGGHAYCSRSTDRGATWSAPILLGQEPDAFGPTGRSACSGPAVEVVPGVLMAAVHGAPVPRVVPSTSTTAPSGTDDGGDDPIVNPTSVRVISSTDDGLTWGRSTLVADSEGDQVKYFEPNLCVLDTGELYCMLRVSTNVRRYSTSTDQGATWSKPVELPMQKVSGRPTTIQCSDPARTMLHVYRPTSIARMARYVTSTDRGRTWGEPGVLTPGAGAVTPGPGGWFTYAQMVETAPGDVAVAFSVESNPGAHDGIGGASYLFFDRITATER